MIVGILAITEDQLPAAHNAAMVYDVRATVDAREYTFRVSISIVQLGDQKVASANFCDDQSKDVFRWHQVFIPQICQLVHAVHNGHSLPFPVYLKE